LTKKSDKPIIGLLSPDLLREYAGELSYSRGVQYAEDGRVTNVRLEDDCIRAKVRGTRLYDVQLREEDGELSYSCTCPFYQEETVFCKHCVAAGLALLKAEGERKGARGGTKPRAERDTSMADVKAHLEKQDKASLVSLLLQQAGEDETLKSRLLMQAAMGAKTVHIPAFRRMIDRAVDWRDFLDYGSMQEYARGIDDVIASLRELLEKGHATEVIDLSEYLLQQLEPQMEMMDDSDGYMSDIVPAIQELHHDACVNVKPDPEQLARKLFQWELQSDWEIFYGAVQQYADVLGKRGLETYRALAEAKWAKMRPIGPGEENLGYSRERFRVTSIMEQLAAHAGDVEKLVAVKTKDLSTAYAYLEIAQLYQKAGKEEKTLEWAEKGVGAFPKETDSRLREFLANEYHKRNRHDNAMQLIWAEFAEQSGFEEYKLLKSHAERSGGSAEWKRWREKALGLIRESALAAEREAEEKHWKWNAVDRSLLVQIFLWEKNVDQAWQEAQEGGCHESLWLELARKREQDHPEDALAVYQSLVEPTIMRMNNDAYRAAAGFAKKAGKLLKQLGRGDEWNEYLNNLRANHRRKRNLIVLLRDLK